MKKRILALMLALTVSMASFAACGKEDAKKSSIPSKAAAYNIGTDKVYTADSNIITFSDPANYTAPVEGEKIVVMTIRNYGNVYIKLFPELAPDACENFTGLVEKGYYDGLTFHRIVRNFVVQGGDPEGTGRGGESLWGDKFACEFSSSLLHLNGAVSYARASGDLRNGSQFYFSVGADVDESTLQSFYNTYSKSYTQAGIDAYLKNGGQPYLDGDYTVFAQVFEGLDVINNVQQVKVDGNDKPVNNVVIEKAVVVEYYDGLIEEMGGSFTGSTSTDDNKVDLENLKPETTGDIVTEFAAAQNFTAPVEGEEIVVLDIKDYGTVKIKLFPELVPNACENFKSLAASGYYDGLTFHRVIEDFIIQSGDPEGTGMGGEAYGGGEIPCEFSNSLVHTLGAIAYARSPYSLTCQSQFYFVTGYETLDEEMFDYLTAQNGAQYNSQTEALYYEKGGYPFLDGSYTVFGQVFEGLDVIMEISRVETDGNDKPMQDVIIEKAEVVEYSAE